MEKQNTLNHKIVGLDNNIYPYPKINDINVSMLRDNKRRRKNQMVEISEA
jgi:hypothetical protein